MFNPLKFKETLGLNTITAPITTNTTTTDFPEDTTLEQFKDEMLGLTAQENTNHYRMGQIYNCIRDRKLAEKAGYKDSKEFFSKYFADLSQATLAQYGSVAESFTEPLSRRFGVTCLYLLLIYKEAADIQINHEEPGDTAIEVPDEKGHVSTLPFKACTVDQMRQAIRRKRKPSSSKPLPPEVEARAEKYCEAVMARFPKGKGTYVKVGVRNEKGKAVLDFKGIPLEQVHQLVEALAAELSPLSALPPAEEAPTA
jgi:hypothetical protein